MAGAVFLVVGFVTLLNVLGVPRRSRLVLDIGRRSVSDLRNPELTDDAKERALQAHSLKLFNLFFQLAVGGAAAIVLPGAVIWLLDRVGIVSFDAVMATTVSWQFLLVSSMVATLYFWLRSGR